LRAGDESVLVPGMVITLEPVIATGPGRILVHEEVIAITEGGARPLSPLAGPDLAVIGA
jgi:Xaa-Pro aminopeptidase